jgi:murein DD-endopeptidase MepM/ murein hydrolase activator NlpD
MALVVVLFIVFLVRKAKHDVPEAPPVKSSLNIIVTAGILVLCILYYTGTNGKPYGSADMALPFKKGNYLVLQGGNGLPTNLFHYNNRKAVLAMDIVKLNAAGNRANCIFSKNLADYEIYGDTVYSPCDGLVTGIENSNPDNKPGIIKRGPKNTNYVIIETEKYRIFLAHFIPGSIMVSEDQRIVKGQPIARVGNSGFSLEPHLHIQVHARTDDTLPWYRENQLQIKFNGRNYLLFDEIKARD